MNENYWKNYYKTHKTNEPSDFAKFCFDFLDKDDIVMDIGAGNCRDTNLFRLKCITLSVDPNFESGDRHHLQKKVKDVELLKNSIIYSRWWLHSVTEDEENDFLAKIAKSNSTLMAEFRVIGDKTDDTHERRLINPEKFILKLISLGFRIGYYQVGYGFSKVGDDNPLLARIIATHKNYGKNKSNK